MCRTQRWCLFNFLCELTYWIMQTEIYRKVFHAVPDDMVTTWKQYKHFVAYQERFTRTVSVLNISIVIFMSHSVSGQD